MLNTPSKFKTTAEFVRFFIPSLTGMVGFWATVALNIPDFTRYAKSQKAQVWGQALGLPATMALYSFIGVAVTSASVVLFGEAIWDPVALLGRFNQPLVAFIALIALLIATLTTNVAANVVSPSNDFANLNPRRISFRTGGMITGVVGVLMMPWKLLSDLSTYVFGWLVGYSALLGPIAGIMIADYFVIRKSQLNVDDLYRRNGIYEYDNGIHGRAVVALVVGIVVALLGLVVPALRLVIRLRLVRRVRRVGRGVRDSDAARGSACEPTRIGDRRMIATEIEDRTPFLTTSTAKWEKPEGRSLHPVTNPATGAVLAKVPFATAADIDRGGERRARGIPEVARSVRWWTVSRCCTGTRRCSSSTPTNWPAILTRENGKTAGRRQGGSAAHDPDGGSGVRHAEPDDGRFAERRGARHRLQDHPAADRGLRGHHAVQLSRRWCRCGCSPSRSRAETASSSSLRRKCR